MATEDLVLKVVMEDAGCTTLTKDCIENVIELVKEGKYPKLDEDELKVLDESLSRLILRGAIRDPKLSEEASALGLQKTAEALAGEYAEKEEASKAQPPTPSVNKQATRPIQQPARVQEAPPQPTTPQTIIRVKTSKVPALLSLISLVVSLGLASLILGLITLPELQIPSTYTMQKYELQLRQLESKLIEFQKNVNSKISSLENKLSKLEEKSNIISSKLYNSTTTLAREISKLKGDVKDLEKRTDILETAVEEIQFRVKYLNESFSSELNAMSKKIFELNSNYSALKNTVLNMKEYIKEITSQLNVLNEKIIELKANLTDYVSKSEFAILSDKLNNTEEEIDRLRNLVKYLSTNLENNSTRIDLIEKEVNRLSKNVDTLERTLETLSNVTSKISVIESKLENLKFEIQELNNSLSNIEKDLLEKVNSVNATYSKYVKKLENEITELQRELEILQKDLKETKESIKGMLLKALNDKDVMDRLAKNLIDKSHLDKKIAEILLQQGSAFYTLVQRIALEVYYQIYQNASFPQTLVPVG